MQNHIMSAVTVSDLFSVLRRGFRDIYFLASCFDYHRQPKKKIICFRGKPLEIFDDLVSKFKIKKVKITINKTAVIIVPESKGSPIVFTKKTSRSTFRSHHNCNASSAIPVRRHCL